MSNLLELILFKTYAELKAEAARYYASFLWWLIEPVLYMGAFYVVFGLVFHRGGEGYVPFLLCGLVIWKWFAGSVSLGANAIQMHMGLIRQVYVKKVVFPAAAMLTNTVRFGFVFIIFTAFLPLFDIAPNVAWIALIPIMLTQFLLNAACGFLAASVVPFVPDIKPLIEKLLMLGFFMSGVFFDIAQVPESIRGYFFLNPMAVLIDGYRSAMLKGVWPAWTPLIVITAISIAVVLLATAIMFRYDRAYPKAMA